MKYKLDSDYNFSDVDVIIPEQVMRDVCDELNRITKGFVTGNVCEYEGNIESYDTLGMMASLAASLNAVTKVDIQDKLGAIGDEIFKYELYLTASQIESYKYRILFISYGIAGYPVKVVLEQGIADELNNKEDSEYIYILECKEEFEKLLVNIFNSNIIKKVIQDLIIASGRKLVSKKQEVD